MKSTVITDFSCKHTKKRYLKGEEFEGSAERVKELSEKGLVEPLKEKAEKTPSESKREKNDKAGPKK